MAILGWAVLCSIMLYLSIVSAIVLVNCAGKWNIGGVPNSLTTRASAWAFACLIVMGWLEVYSMAPFEITVK